MSLQDVGIHAIIAQSDALGYELIGLFSPFQPYSSNFFLTFFEKKVWKMRVQDCMVIRNMNKK